MDALTALVNLVGPAGDAAKSTSSLRARHFLLKMANQASIKESQEACRGSQWKRKRQGRKAM